MEHKQNSLHACYSSKFIIFTMKIMRLYYVTGTMLILLTISLSFLGMLTYESILVFGLSGILLLLLGVIQHLLLLYD